MNARGDVSALESASIADVARPPLAAGRRDAQLRAVQITRQFGGLRALDDVSLDLRPGEVHGLIGPNGSGKTTMLNLLSGYYPPTAGAIRFGDEDLSAQSVQRRAHVGIARTFQKPRLLPMLSVLENAVLGAWPHARSGFLATSLALPSVAREDKVLLRRATELLHGVGLGHVLHRRANLLDHAEQRFLEIARGLATGPKFILLDEPAGGLTEIEIGHLSDVVLAIRGAGVGVLLVEHHTDFVFRICDRVTTLNLGKMIKYGTPDEVRGDPEVIRVYLGA